jgi:hypothetical protein
VRHVEIGVDVGKNAREFFFGGNIAFRALALLQNGLSLLLVLPERRIADFCFEGFYDFAAGGNVKDNSARVRCASSVLRSGIEDLQLNCSQFPF